MLTDLTTLLVMNSKLQTSVQKSGDSSFEDATSCDKFELLTGATQMIEVQRVGSFKVLGIFTNASCASSALGLLTKCSLLAEFHPRVLSHARHQGV